MKIIKALFIVLAIIASCSATAQVAINIDGSPADNSAMLDVKSTEKGFLPPRLTEAEIINISNPANGLLVFNADDSKVYMFVSAESKWKEIQYGTGTITPTPPEVGDSYGGGIVFWLDGSGGGLIAAIADQGTFAWWNGSNTATGATATALGTGSANTTAIIASQGNTGAYAAKICRDYDGGDYDDWFLPSKDELEKLYDNRAVIGAYVGEWHWSSSQTANSMAWGKNFHNGLQIPWSKGAVLRVRAIRAF